MNRDIALWGLCVGFVGAHATLSVGGDMKRDAVMYVLGLVFGGMFGYFACLYVQWRDLNGKR